MDDLIVILVVLAIIALAVWYIVKAKKNGKKCIGCPDGCSCGSGTSGCGGCSGCHTEDK